MILLNSALLLLVASFGLVHGSDVLFIQHAPSYYQIASNSKCEHQLKSSQLPEVICAAIGFSNSKDFCWDGIKSSSFFERPKAVCVLEFDGFDNINTNIAKNKFPITVDVEPQQSFPEVSANITSRYPSENAFAISVTNDNNFYTDMAQYPDILNKVDPDPEKMDGRLRDDDSIFSIYSLKSLSLKNNVDQEFLSEMQLWIDVCDALIANEDKIHNYKPSDFIWMQSVALKNLKEIYGVDSPQLAEALTVIQNVLKRIEACLKKLYADNFVLFVLTVDYLNEVPKSRMGRSLLAADTQANATTFNLSPSYDQDYPAMFNILLFVSLLLSLTVFAIALGMWHIDPGRDSIIYRMTSQRMKKDQ